MAKYTIETDGITADSIQGYLGFPIEICGKRTWVKTDMELTPYTEPDIDVIKQEEYEKGYKTAKVQCNIQAEKDMREVGRRHYQKGLSDAWDAARTLWNTPNKKEIFGYTVFSNALMSLTGQEVIEKIRQYEQEQEEQIQVGDEIETPSGLKGYVVNFTDDELVHYVSSEGRFGTMGMSAVSKTGRHFPEIAEVLQKMRES